MVRGGYNRRAERVWRQGMSYKLIIHLEKVTNTKTELMRSHAVITDTGRMTGVRFLAGTSPPHANMFLDSPRLFARVWGRLES